jgi:TonB family protein
LSVLLIVVGVVTSAAAPTTLTSEQKAKLALYTPTPQYPIRALGWGMKGDGSYLLRVQVWTGVVKDVQVEHSTGYSILDSAAASTLKQWRFKPGALPPIKVQLPQLKDRFAAEDSFVRVPVHFGGGHGPLPMS